MDEDKFIRVVSSLPLFAKNFLIIADKEGHRVLFNFNRAQRYVHEKIEEQLKRLGYVRILVLKGRQQGISTYIQARFFHKVITQKGKKAFILTHHGKATIGMFEMTKRYYNNLPKGLAPLPVKDNQNQLLFGDPINSGYAVGTAGSGEIGRSMTNQLLHLSEYAFYANTAEIKAGLEQTVADAPGTEKIKESTANGVDNAFYADWQAAKDGKSDWLPIFVPWYWDNDYTRQEIIQFTDEEKDWMALYQKDGLTMQHLAWRRNRLADFGGDYSQKCKKFRQEYPFTDEEAFLSSITDTFITAEPVRRARDAKVNSESALVIGVDVARFGSDATCIVRRKGRLIYNLQLYKGLDTMQTVGRLKTIIDSERPSKVFIDDIGVGGGVVDRLKEMGYSCVEGINVARWASDSDKYGNLRAELWSEMRNWFNQDMPVQIPDDPDLQKELCGLGYFFRNSSGALMIESKEDAKKRGLESPNRADACMLTFAYGQYAGGGSYQTNFLPSSTDSMFI